MSATLLLASLDEVLLQGERLLQSLSDAQYCAKGPGLFEASIGAHYRHNLEHFKTMFQVAQAPLIDYDARARDLRIENDRQFGLEVTRDLRHAARFLNVAQLEKPVQAQCQTGYGDDATSSASSTFGREIMYAISHAVHHYALIAMICEARKIAVPPDFGVAPSTLQHQKQIQSV